MSRRPIVWTQLDLLEPTQLRFDLDALHSSASMVASLAGNSPTLLGTLARCSLRWAADADERAARCVMACSPASCRCDREAAR
jgi:hypothetical protein